MAVVTAADATGRSPRCRGRKDIQVYAPSLTGLADRFHFVGPNVDLDCHIRDIAGLLRFEDLREVILVGHGYGGMVITGAADRVPQRVGILCIWTAATPANGQSLSEIAPGVIGALRRDVETINGVELCPFPSLFPTSDGAVKAFIFRRFCPSTACRIPRFWSG